LAATLSITRQIDGPRAVTDCGSPSRGFDFVVFNDAERDGLVPQRLLQEPPAAMEA